MTNDASRSAILEGLIKQAGVPITGITVNDVNAIPPAVTINYKPEATTEQMATAEALKNAFDWRKRRLLARNVVVAALNALTNAEKNAIFLHLICEKLRQDPSAAAAIGQFLGTPISVDEVDPT